MTENPYKAPQQLSGARSSMLFARLWHFLVGAVYLVFSVSSLLIAVPAILIACYGDVEYRALVALAGICLGAFGLGLIPLVYDRIAAALTVPRR